MIEKCNFGKIVVEGRTYDSDLWIFPDRRVQDSWWRKDGHRLRREDISALIATRPEILVVGTGIYGRMRILIIVYMGRQVARHILYYIWVDR